MKIRYRTYKSKDQYSSISVAFIIPLSETLTRGIAIVFFKDRVYIWDDAKVFEGSEDGSLYLL